MKIEFTILGSVPSKKNQTYVGRYGQVYKPNQVKDFERDSIYQVRSQMNRLKVQFPVLPIKVEVYFKQKKDRDLDNMLSTMLDILQSSNIIHNDSEIYHLEAKKEKSQKDEVRIVIKT